MSLRFAAATPVAELIEATRRPPPSSIKHQAHMVSLTFEKPGGCSVAEAESIKRMAQCIAKTRTIGYEIVVAVSATRDTSDELLDLAHQVIPEPHGREMGLLLTTGGRTSMVLLALAIKGLNHTPRG